jgi:hypothetical protein
MPIKRLDSEDAWYLLHESRQEIARQVYLEADEDYALDEPCENAKAFLEAPELGPNDVRKAVIMVKTMDHLLQLWYERERGDQSGCFDLLAVQLDDMEYNRYRRDRARAKEIVEDEC